MHLSLLLTPLALAVDHGPWDQTLSRHATATRVDYAALGGDALDPYLKTLASAPAPSGRDEQLAFWINAYNALTVDLVAENIGGIESIRDLDGGDPWGTRSFTVAGKSVTLNDIEHNILRPMGDPRIHAAVNCASIGCPPLRTRAYTTAGIDAELDEASRTWVRRNALDKTGDEVALSRIFDWYGEDFLPSYGSEHFDIPGVEGKQEAALNFIAAYSDAETKGWIRAGGYSVSWSAYDWRLNKK